MKIENLHTGKQYTLSKESYEALENNKKLFKIIDETDEDVEVTQIIDNINKPSTGEKIQEQKNKS